MLADTSLAYSHHDADPSRLVRLSAALEGASLLVTEADTQGIITYANGAALRYFGYTPAECIGKTVLELTHPDDRERLQQAVITWI